MHRACLCRANFNIANYLTDNILSTCDCIKDFGITLVKDFTYLEHIENITYVTTSKLYVIEKCFRSGSIPLL